ncbi:hypothetical protein [uncultured Bacteroides sp.]|uniref:hypothetical protein n=1 Tax=uncultured Bacteroides sp. TaxID=162156 RepID=UPI002AAB9657|nr:hypothetical protein [uncultured Bacteroides sp.]
MEEIIIDLQDSSNAKGFKVGNLVHQREFNKAKELIEKRIARASSFKHKNEPKQRYNDTISILGSRGSGKTSFLLSLLAECKESKNIEVLDIIDPTLIEEKGHIFLTIISLIKESVYKKIDLSNCTPNDSSYQKKIEWKDKLRKLADGLPSIDGVGSGLNDSSWQDAEYIMNKGIKSVNAATNLEDNFNKIINCALEILDKDAFIITLDDIDVDFRKGWPVLETIRKYLTSPQIIVLLSGDLKLYSKAIRKQQWKNFGKALLKNEAESLNKMNSYNDLVTEMESQYMQKVIKPENRIRLTTLFEKLELYKDKICIKINKSDENENSIVDFYNSILSTFGIKNRSQAEAYSSFLLNLPLRTQIQFLFESYQLLTHKENTIKQESDITNVINAFLSDLYEKEVDIDLARNLPKMLNVVILKFLIKEQGLAEYYQLQPTSTDSSFNSSLTALSFLFSQQVKNRPYLIFDYMIKIGYVRNLIKEIGYKSKNNELYSIEDLCQSSGIYQDKVLRDIVGNITAYIRGVLNTPKENIEKRFAGIIPLTGLASRAKGKNKEHRIDYEFKNDDKYILASIPLTISSNNWKNSTILTSSIYVLLASICEFVKLGNLNSGESDDKRDIEIANELLELSQIQTYLMPNFNLKDTISNEVSDLEFDKEETNDNSSPKNLFSLKVAKFIREWIDRYPNKKISVSPHLLGKISTRLFYALDSIEKQTISNLGDCMYRRIIALANAIIIEEIKENVTKEKDLNLDNTISADRVFKKNIKVATTNKDELPLSLWLLSCPLFLLYLPSKENELINEYINFIEPGYSNGNIKPKEIIKDSIYEKLKEVAIAGIEYKSKTEEEKKEDNSSSKENSSKEIIFDCSYNTIKILIEKGIKYSLFSDTESATRTRNDLIRISCKEYFTNDINGTLIKDFIEFINNYNSENKEKVEEWKQAQS